MAQFKHEQTKITESRALLSGETFESGQTFECKAIRTATVVMNFVFHGNQKTCNVKKRF